jgi:hypothetical protein
MTFPRRIMFGLLVVLGSARAAHDEPARVSVPDKSGIVAASCDTFLSSLGVNTHVDQGYDPASYIEPLRYLGVRHIRDSPRNLSGLIMLHAQTGVRVDLLGADVAGLTVAANTLARSAALLSIEGPNEPNNFPVTYNGQESGGTTQSWDAVARLQMDLYSAVKSNPELGAYPVFHVSEGGAETDNVGLQFLTIPTGAGTLLPDGTKFADYANVHNYVTGVRGGYGDNQAWQAADPTLNARWDGLYGNYGTTWKKHFRGYSKAELEGLPRVTTETGWDAATPADERIQGTVLVNTYLAQFKRGWRYTFIYQLGEGEGGGGNQGLFHQDWTPKPAATYIHNLTSILADDVPIVSLGKLDYSIENAPATVHDLLLQKSNGVFALVVWGEQVIGENSIVVNLGGTYPEVNVYDATSGISPVQTLTNTDRVPLTISDHPLIVEIHRTARRAVLERGLDRSGEAMPAVIGSRSVFRN